MITLFVIRHGESEYNATDYTSGQSNPKLTLAGKEHAKQAAKALHGVHIDEIISSDLDRALETAQIIVKTLNLKLKIKITPEIREINYGIYQGIPKDEIRKLKEYREKDLDYVFEDGESYRQMYDRVINYIEKHKKEWKGKNVILVCHGRPISALTSHYKKTELKSALAKKIKHEEVEKIIITD